MALKDWSITTDIGRLKAGYWSTRTYASDRTQDRITVSFENMRGALKPWNVVTYTYGIVKFSTKSAALKYAKAYMRMH